MRSMLERMADEDLVPGVPATIDLTYDKLFRDERPATVWRVDVGPGVRRVLVRDETNGVLRDFRKYPHTGARYREAQAQELSAKGSFLVFGERRDALTFENRAHIQSCDLCGELDPVGALGRCGRCLEVEMVVRRRSGGPPVDADYARALVRHELAIEEQPSMRGVLEQLDGLAPWHFLSEPFVNDEDGLDDRLAWRAVLLEKVWRGSFGSLVVLPSVRGHRWTTTRDGSHSARFHVEASEIRVEPTAEVIAVRRELPPDRVTAARR